MTYTDWQQQDHVRELQEYLRTVALTDNNYLELAVDGIFGEETAEAVRAYQLANQLPVTGKADSITWDHLLRDYLDALTLLSEAVPLHVFPLPQAVLRPGDRGTTIYILQAMLNSLEEKDALTVNGYYDAATTEYVRHLQTISGFTANGEVDRAFWDHLATWYNHA